MSEHEQTESPQPEASPPEPAPRRLFRSRDDRVVGGVAGGLGRYFGIDPIIFRIAFVGLTLVSGIGLILYVGALLFLPVEGEERRRRSVLTWIGVGVLALVALWLVAHTFFWFGGGDPFFPPVPFLFLLLIGGAVYWLARGRGSGETRNTGRLLAIAAFVALTAPIVLVGSFWVAAAGGGVMTAGLVIAVGALLDGARFIRSPPFVGAGDSRLDPKFVTA